jgi:predicted GH43/DUF377 family glycosyl hydrolase
MSKKKWDDLDSFWCYAESDDTINWTKPNLGIVEFDGSKDNNILVVPPMTPNNKGIHGSAVFIDPHAGSEDEKYKMTYCGPKSTTLAAVSKDGIHWNFKKEPIINSQADSQNIIYWDEFLQKYVGYFRIWRKERRGVARSVSEDFWHWPDPEVILLSDPRIPADSDYYTSSFHVWPGTEKTHDAFLMLPAVYHKTSDQVNIELYLSRNGIQWQRSEQNPIMSPAIGPSYHDNSVYFGRGLWQEEPGKWSMFYSDYPRTHNDYVNIKPNMGGFHKATWREDGFAGLEASDFGEFWTAKFSMESCQEIKINALTKRSGWIKVALYDNLRNCEIEQFTLEDCNILNGDLLWDKITWNKDSDVSDFDDVILRLHISMFQATLFGIRFD